MKQAAFLSVALALITFLFPLPLLSKDVSEPKSGEQLFKEHCAACHVNGGNILNPQKTLSRKDREANNIKTAEDIVGKMRNPGPVPTHPQEWSGMKMFDQKTLSDEDAKKIAEYVLKTY